MSDKKTEVFCLTDAEGRLLPPAVQATILAKYSRSPLSARVLIDQLTPEEADKFQKKYVIEFNHSSVAELAVIPLCFEGVSIVASKFLESFQRPGYSEKSTRYQVFSRDSFITPPDAPPTMAKFAARLYDAYDSLYPKVVKRVAEILGKDPTDPKTLTSSFKGRVFDNVRYLLPAGTGTNLAWVGFARDARYMISAARGHSNPEIRALGEMTAKAVATMCPVFVEKADADTFEPTVRNLGSLSPKFDFENPKWYVDLHRRHLLPDPQLVEKSFEVLVADHYGMSWSAFSKLMESREKRAVPKAFRSIKLAFEIMMDYGAFRDLQRHRRCEQYVEPLHTNYGYLVPDDIAGSDFEAEYHTAMKSILAYDDEAVVHDTDLMQYMVPLGYLHRSVFEMDAQEVYYVTELRTAPQGHISYRRVAYEMSRVASARLPNIFQWCKAINPTTIGEHK
jgi:thymidylate synthase ThyX